MGERERSWGVGCRVLSPTAAPLALYSMAVARASVVDMGASSVPPCIERHTLFHSLPLSLSQSFTLTESITLKDCEKEGERGRESVSESERGCECVCKEE